MAHLDYTQHYPLTTLSFLLHFKILISKSPTLKLIQLGTIRDPLPRFTSPSPGWSSISLLPIHTLHNHPTTSASCNVAFPVNESPALTWQPAPFICPSFARNSSPPKHQTLLVVWDDWKWIPGLASICIPAACCANPSPPSAIASLDFKPSRGPLHARRLNDLSCLAYLLWPPLLNSHVNVVIPSSSF